MVLTRSQKNIYNAYMLSTAQERDEGIYWYLNARSICRDISKKTGYKFLTVCGVMAALSPFVTWDQNIKDTMALLKDTNYTPGTFKNQRNKAQAIIGLGFDTNVSNICSILRGEKTTNFFLNIYSPHYNRVTVDRHIISLYLDQVGAWQTWSLTPKRYRQISNDIKYVANKLNLKPYQLQAIIWLAWRRLGKEGLK
jgi:hypothetical protein